VSDMQTENAVRKAFERKGLLLRKYRIRAKDDPRFGRYYIVNLQHTIVHAGPLTPEQVEQILMKMRSA